MTEADWWGATDPVWLLAWLSHAGPDFDDEIFEELVRRGLFQPTDPYEFAGSTYHYAPNLAAPEPERRRQVQVLHDIFGPLPFREVAVDPRWLTADVVALTQGIYDAKAFDRLPILADALMDAGCDNDELLKHCRAEKWEHVRGCWVVDLLLGKPWRETVAS